MKKNKNLIFDVGMHKGEDTDYYLKKGFKVIGFEADPELIYRCKQRFADEVLAKKLIIVEGAIIEPGATEDTVRFYKNKDNSVWGTIVEDWAERNEKLGTSNEIIEVPAVNFTECLKQYGIPYYLKIDIEGMDVICLEALLEFTDKPDYISIESEKVSFEKLKAEFSIFENLGYDSFQLVNQADISSMKEPANSKEGNYLNYKFEFGSSGLFGTDLPSRWKNAKQAINNYQWIFRAYKIFGDNSNMKDNFIFFLLRKFLSKLLNQTVPGWYDTHARHSSVKTDNLL